MSLILFSVGTLVVCALIAIWVKYRHDQAERQLERHSITPDELNAILSADQGLLLVFDVRQPLDLLADSEIIPSAKRIPPKDVLENPSLIPSDKDCVVYCTCPSDKTSRRVVRQALDRRLLRVKVLKGGLAGWKAKGYPVEPYTATFQLDIRT
jgi:rhodanese-related sulfurtransferase